MDNPTKTQSATKEGQRGEAAAEISKQKQGAQSGAAAVRDEAAKTAEEVKRSAGQAAESVKAEAAAVAKEVQSAASDVANQAMEEGCNFVHRQKDRAAEELSHMEAAIRRASETLREEEDDNLADYADRAARQLSRVKQYLQDRDLQSLMHDMEETARRKPEMVFGALFVAGLATARFLKASSHRRATSRGRTSRRQRRETQMPRSDYEWSSASQQPSYQQPYQQSHQHM